MVSRKTNDPDRQKGVCSFAKIRAVFAQIGLFAFIAFPV